VSNGPMSVVVAGHKWNLTALVARYITIPAIDRHPYSKSFAYFNWYLKRQRANMSRKCMINRTHNRQRKKNKHTNINHCSVARACLHFSLLIHLLCLTPCIGSMILPGTGMATLMTNCKQYHNNVCFLWDSFNILCMYILLTAKFFIAILKTMSNQRPFFIPQMNALSFNKLEN
jgi:hypothetical protein